LVRDARIAQIYEGTNGIQAMDLIGRKLLLNQGEFLKIYLEEIHGYLESIEHSVMLLPFVEALKMAANTLEQVTKAIFSGVKDDAFLPGTAANDYLHLVGYVSYTYMWAKMAQASQSKVAESFHDAKLKTGLFFVQRLLPQISSLATAIVQGSQATMALDVEQF
jgi:hypothetical protein